MIRFFASCLLGASLITPAVADTRAAVGEHIIPHYAAFSNAASALADVAGRDCSVSSILPAYHAAFDAWIAVSHIQFGPIETRGTALALSFWPDPKDRVGKAIARLLAEQPDLDPQSFAEVSIAAQGFMALERFLTDPALQDTAFGCDMRRAIANYIAGAAGDLEDDWQAGYGAEFAAGNVPSYQTVAETRRALYTAISTSLAFQHDARLGRPLGTFDRPHPKRAEVRRTSRSQRHIVLSLAALKELTQVGFADVVTDEVHRAFDTAIARANALNDPDLSGVSDPVRRLKVEVLQRAVRDVQVLVAEQVAGALGITAGFNSLDGD